MNTKRIVYLLEKVRDNLDSTDQKKPTQHNQTSTSAAKAKLKELETKLSAGRSKQTKVQAAGSKRK